MQPIGKRALFCSCLALAWLAALAPSSPAEFSLLEGVAAQVGDEVVLESEVQEQLAVARLRFAIADSNVAAAREQILGRMIDEKIIVQEARVQGITAGADEIERAVEQYVASLRETLPSEEALQSELDREGITYDDLLDRYRDEARREILYSRLVQREIYAQVEVSDEDVVARFTERRNELPAKPELVRLSHVFVAIRPNDTVVDAAQKRLDEVNRRVTAGEEFAAIVRDLSDDPGTRDNGGDIGWFGRGELDPTFEEVAFALEPGQVSEPFQTGIGIEIVQLIEKDEEKDRIRARHLLILLRATESDYRRAREEAARVYELARGGTDFATLAAEHSDDEDSAARGGDLGEFQVPEMAPFLAQSIAGIEVGELSEVVESPQGFHVFKVTERQAGGAYTLDEIREQLRNMIVEERAANLTESWLAEIRGNYFIRRTDQETVGVAASPAGGTP